MRQAVHHLKYRNLKLMARPLGRMLASYLESEALPGQVVVPVPMHPRRLRERGYNQSELLARELARESGLTVSGILHRSRAAPPQARASSAQARRQNVAGAFTCHGYDVAGRHVILVDDVCTTGATLDSCATALKQVGAASVWGLTVAREI